MVRFNLVITLLLMISIAVKSELTNRMFDVRHVGYAEGLSSQRVFSIVEDGDGAMWIATKTGIDRYNGHTVKNYDLPGRLYQTYLGEKLLHESDLKKLDWQIHPASDASVSPRGWEVCSGSGNEDFFEPALGVTHADGNASTWLY